VTDADLQRIADELGEPIEIVREMSDAIECCAGEGALEARSDRWERARDAAYDAPGAAEAQLPNLDAAIETALRVRIDDEVLAAAVDSFNRDSIDTATELSVAVTAAFRAAGFEVEQ